MSTRRPFLVIVPGGSQNPSQYALFAHLLLSAGYPVYTGLLPSVGTTSRVTTTEDTAWVRDHMIIPALDREERDVIIITHSYGSVPGSAAALGLDKASRAKEGKKTGVIGQIHIAGTIHKGGDGKSIVESFGGEYPPHLQVDTENDLMLMADRIPPLYNDVKLEYAEVLAISTVAQGLTALNSPCPLASWSDEAFRGRFAYVITLQDQCIPPQLQHMMLDLSGADWIKKEIDAGHSPQVSQPEKLVEIVLELAKGFE